MKGAILGAQRLAPTARTVMRELGLEGPVALITAGWQEREDLDRELHRQLGPGVTNLHLYQRGEQVFGADPEFAKLHRARQEVLRHRQEHYRIRLAHSIDAALDIARLSAGTPVEEEEARESLEQIRWLDQDHLARCKETNREFEERVRPLERTVVARHRAEVEAILKRSSCLVIAGGHVAVLLNRLRMFGVAELLGDKPLVAWSGGAMVTSERVVLFHESPPQGVGISEVLDEGLGLHRGVVPLPNPKLRLKLDDPLRVSWMARRHQPALCVALDSGESVKFDGDRWHGAHGTQLLKADGTVGTGWAS